MIARLLILSDVHYAGPLEQKRSRYETRSVDHPAARMVLNIYRRYIWLRDPFAHNHLLPALCHQAGEVDHVIGNGDFSCDSAFIGVSDPAARQSAELCLGYLRERYGEKFQPVLGDHAFERRAAVPEVLEVASRKLFLIGLGLLFALLLTNIPYFYQKFYLSNFYAGRDLVQRGADGGMFENDRSRMLLAAGRFAEEFPLGIGLGNYKVYNAYYGRKEVWNTTVFTSAHGSFAQILSEAGWPGLITMLWLLGASGRVMFLYYRRGANISPWRRAFLLGTFGGAVGNFCSAFLGDYLFPTYHNGGMGSFGATIYTWMYLGVGLAIGREDRLEPANEPPARYVPKSPVIHRRVEGVRR